MQARALFIRPFLNQPVCNKEYYSQKRMRWKLWLIRIGFSLTFLGLLVNLYRIQILHGAYYIDKADAQQQALDNLSASRGIIYFTDKNGTQIPAVMNKEYPTIYAVPTEIKDPATAAHLLAPLFNRNEAALAKTFARPGDEYELLAAKGTDQQVNQVQALNLKGVYIRQATFRFYPFGTMASQLLGYVTQQQDGTSKGMYGLESQFNSELSGKDGYMAGNTIFKAQNGQDIHTTIDFTIQAQAENVLADMVKKWHATGGSIVVEDPYTGNILTMASYPDFDPNNYGSANIDDFINPVVQKLYEPGSVFKPLTMTAGIDTGKITPDTTYMDTGSDTINGYTIHDWDLKAHGLTTMRGVIEQSLNLGTIFAEKTMGDAIFRDYVQRFGLGQKTGIDLPGELAGNIKHVISGRPVDYATASFGQGISVTPLQMMSAFSAIANGGLLLKPQILAGQQPQVIRRVASENTEQQVVSMMVSAVNVNVLARVDGYNVAAKSGTAYIPDFVHGGYTKNVIDTFMGFAPAYHPKFVLMVKLNDPLDAPLSGTAVVPTWQQMATFILNYYQVPPDALTASSSPSHP